MRTIDLIGQKFGKLTVIDKTRNGNKPRPRWVCKCECGNIINTPTTNSLTSGNTKSCGCIKPETSKYLNYSHGMSKSKFYIIWCNMIKRCAHHEAYYENIEVCDSWKSFENFKKDMLDTYIEGLSIERKDITKGYCPENCTWINISEQSYNKRNTIFVDYKNDKMSLAKACKLSNNNYMKIYTKYRKTGILDFQKQTGDE